MGYQTKFDGSTERTIQLGGKNADGINHPTSLEGYFLGSKSTQSEFGEGKLHIFQTSEGTVGVWGKARLDKLLSSDLIGQMVLVTFTGMIPAAKKGRRPSYGYKVQHDPENTIDVSSVNLSSAASEEDGYEAESYESEELSDEVAVAAPKAPAAPASTPSASRQARVQELLNKSRNRVA